MKTKKLLICGMLIFTAITGVIAQVNNYSAPTLINVGDSNTLVGVNAGQNNTGNYNTFSGFGSGQNNTAQHNSGFGWSSLLNNTGGGFNAAFGSEALSGNTSGSYNCAFGSKVLTLNTGSNNIAIGFKALWLNTSVSGNIAIGYAAGLYTSPTNYTDNIAIGHNTPRNFNLGTSPGGISNIFFGNSTAQYLYSGNNNVIIGNNISLKNATSTADEAGNNTSNTVILSDGQGNQRLFFHSNGYAGIGLGNNFIPKNRLELKGGISGTFGLRFNGQSNATSPTVAPNGKVLTINSTGDVVLTTDVGSGGTTVIANGINTTYIGSGVTSDPYKINAENIYTHDGNLTANRTVNMANNRMIFDTQADGRIYIGDTNATNPFTVGAGNNFPIVSGPESNYRLLVEGGLLTEKVKIALRYSGTDWADYVFADNYQLMSLKEVENFIKANKHLPGVDSAEDLVEKGLDVAEMQAKQMEKIEELTLYVIEQNKALEQQNKEIEVLKAQVKLLLGIK